MRVIVRDSGLDHSTNRQLAIENWQLRSPYLTPFVHRPNHLVAQLAVEGFSKLRHVGERTVHAKATKRMRVGEDLLPNCFRPLVPAPDLRPTEEETLFRSEAINVRRTWFTFE